MADDKKIKSVPTEPTEEMVAAGVASNPTSWTEDTDIGFMYDVARVVWAAMIEAAPDLD